MPDWGQLAEQYLDRLRAELPDALRLNIVDGEHSSHPGAANELAWSGTVDLRRKQGNDSHRFRFEMWNAYLANATVTQQIERAKRWIPGPRGDKLLLFARYLPLPTAQRLVDAGVDFIDLTGNIHLVLDSTFQKTIIGKKEAKGIWRPDRFTSSHAQVLFTLAAHPEWLTLSVRELGERTGIGKSHIANVRQTLLERGLVQASESGLKLAPMEDLEREMVRSYDMVLRPKLFAGRYRSPHKHTAELLSSIHSHFESKSIRWSLTGGYGADRIQHYYSGADRVFFFETVASDPLKALRFVPDRKGDITILRSFGDVCFWKPVDGIAVAHPWLIYAELLWSPDPRAQDAASQFLHTGNAWL